MNTMTLTMLRCKDWWKSMELDATDYIVYMGLFRMIGMTGWFVCALIFGFGRV